MPAPHVRAKHEKDNGLLQPTIMFLLFSTFYIFIPLMMFTFLIARSVYYLIIIILSGLLYSFKNSKETQFHEPLTTVQDNEYWLNRCSICFDKKHEFCLNRCRDQFCKSCFSRYVQEVVNNSWGLNVTNVTCPVCRDVLPLNEWSKHVDSKIVKLYKDYNQPFRPLTRFCSSCEEPCFEPYVDYDNNPRNGKEIVKRLNADYKEILALMQLSKVQISYYSKEFKITYAYLLDGTPSQGTRHYSEIMNAIKQLSDESDPYITHSEEFLNLVTDFSLQLISIETKADIWKKLQFLHISLFPNLYCPECCKPVCLKCNATSHHFGYTCLEYLEYMSNSKARMKESSKATLKWMVQNSKSCPSCHILIQREEGCNKVSCLYCGGEFCWMCMKHWEDGCGFYRCGSGQTDSSQSDWMQSPSAYPSTTSYPSGEAPELGIPDVKSIEAKFNNLLLNNRNLRRR